MKTRTLRQLILYFVLELVSCDMVIYWQKTLQTSCSKPTLLFLLSKFSSTFVRSSLISSFVFIAVSYINTGRRLQSYFGDNQSSRRRTEESQVLRKKSSTTTLKFSELCISAPRKRERTLIINLQHPRFPTLAHFSSRTGYP